MITNLYKGAKSCVDYNGGVSNFFASNVGVRQGENLSPMLFAIFLNDMEDFFAERGGVSLSLISKLDTDSRAHVDRFIKLFVLLYADDTVFLADNERDMQHLLHNLYDFCNVNKLGVNTTKTKVLVFSRSKIRLRNLPVFTLGTDPLERVEEYTYLGILFTWNGSFTKAKKVLADKATRAMYAIIKKGTTLDLPIDIMLKLFDACVLPILLYAAEVCGFGNNDVLERVHTKFCKIMCKKSKYTHNSTIYAELGRIPISIYCRVRMVNFWYRILHGKQSKICFILYNILKNLDDKQKYTSPWLDCVKKTL